MKKKPTLKFEQETNYKNSGGVYIIKNIINNKFYVGSTKNFTNRNYRHSRFLRYNKHYSVILQRAYNKYGFNNFVFIPILVTKDLSRLNLLKLEQECINYLKPAYNAMPNATSCGRILTEKTIEKQKQSLLDNFKKLGITEKRGNMRGIIIKDTNGVIVEKYRSREMFKKITGHSTGFLRNRLNGIPCKILKYRGYIFEEY